MRKINFLIILVMLVSCATRETPAPIVNITAPINKKITTTANVSNKPSKNITNDVTSEPTISKIDKNDSPIVIDSSVVTTNSAKTTIPKPVVASAPIATKNTISFSNEWIMPTLGKITQSYTASNKGINITGKDGQEIMAINSGKVVYSGNGLKGYGNLIIIKHNTTYLSAYAHNKVNLVKEGDTVTRGQKIAEMGNTDSKSTMLHLEIRKNGKPINPETLIKG